MKPKNWGQVKGGLNSTGNTKKIKYPKPCNQLAELVGIILGDGNINAYKRGKKVATYSIRIVGHSQKDRDYLMNFVTNLVRYLFEIKPRFYFSKRCNALYLAMDSKRLVEFFKTVGLVPGNKIKNGVRIPDWIWKKREYVTSCLRGLIDTDGCIIEMIPKYPGTYSLHFENFSLPLLQDVRRAFLELGFTPTKIYGSKTPHGNRVSLTRQGEIRKFYKEIGFNNLKHILRYSPVV